MYKNIKTNFHLFFLKYFHNFIIFFCVNSMGKLHWCWQYHTDAKIWHNCSWMLERQLIFRMKTVAPHWCAPRNTATPKSSDYSSHIRTAIHLSSTWTAARPWRLPWKRVIEISESYCTHTNTLIGASVRTRLWGEAEEVPNQQRPLDHLRRLQLAPRHRDAFIRPAFLWTHRNIPNNSDNKSFVRSSYRFIHHHFFLHALFRT